MTYADHVAAMSVMYKARCAGCGQERITFRFTLTPQFCNRDCEARYNVEEATRESHSDSEHLD